MTGASETWVGLHQRGDHSVAVNQDGSKLRWRDTTYVRQSLVDQAMANMREAQKARDSLRQQCDDLEVQLRERDEVVEAHRKNILELQHAYVKLQEKKGDLATREQVEQLESELESVNKELRSRTAAVDELSEELEAAQVSPLDLTQHQRARALEKARDVLTFDGEGELLSINLGVSYEQIVAAADFITTGLISLHPADRKPVRDLMDRVADESQSKRDGGRTKAEYLAWKSGIEEVAGWLEGTLSDTQPIPTANGGVSLPRLIANIRDDFEIGGDGDD